MALLELNRHPGPRELRWFGLSSGAFLALVGAIAAWRFQAPLVARGFWIAAGISTLLYYAVPPLRRPLFVGWQYLTYPLGWMLSLLALAVLYYACLTPIALVLRLSGRDALRLRRRHSSTYWVKRPAPPPAARYFRQF